MMSYEQFLLTKLAEECNEVAQRALKQQQFGSEEHEPGDSQNNAQRTLYELNDLLAVVDLLIANGDLPDQSALELEQHKIRKRAKILKYLEYSRDLKLVKEQSPDIDFND